MQGTFPRCKKCLPSDDEMHHLVVDAIVLVHNFRTDYVGYSQIKLYSNLNMSVLLTSKVTNCTVLFPSRRLLVKLTGAEMTGTMMIVT